MEKRPGDVLKLVPSRGPQQNSHRQCAETRAIGEMQCELCNGLYLPELALQARSKAVRLEICDLEGQKLWVLVDFGRFWEVSTVFQALFDP